MSNPLKKLYFYLKYANKNEHTQEIGNITLRFSTQDRYSKSWFYPRYDKGNIHEPAVAKLLLQELKPTDCFFDVGANLGYFTCLAARICKTTVHTFEMDSYCIPLINRNVKLNQLENVVVNNNAISDKTGNEYIPRLSQPNAGLQLLTNTEGIMHTEVPAITLDKYIADYSLAPTFLKIDVEGAEMKVLKGMTQLLQKTPKLLIEIHPKNLLDFNSTYQEVIAFLLQNGYSIEEITDHRSVTGGRKKVNLTTIISQNTMLFAKKHKTD